jgi:hypothetical protein
MVAIKNGSKLSSDSDSDMERQRQKLRGEESGANLPSSSGDHRKRIPKESSGSRKKRRLNKSKRSSSLLNDPNIANSSVDSRRRGKTGSV